MVEGGDEVVAEDSCNGAFVLVLCIWRCFVRGLVGCFEDGEESGIGYIQ